MDPKKPVAKIQDIIFRNNKVQILRRRRRLYNKIIIVCIVVRINVLNSVIVLTQHLGRKGSNPSSASDIDNFMHYNIENIVWYNKSWASSLTQQDNQWKGASQAKDNHWEMIKDLRSQNIFAGLAKIWPNNNKDTLEICSSKTIEVRNHNRRTKIVEQNKTLKSSYSDSRS